MNILEIIAKEEEKAERTKAKARGRCFAVILYPDEDERHRKFLAYVSNQPRFQVCFIFHDPEEETKKRHCHCLVVLKNAMLLDSFIKFFDCWISYAELINDRESYIAYMLHDTPHSIAAGKKPYSLSDLQGDERLWRNFRQNKNFVLFGEVFQYYRKGDTMLTLLEKMQNECLPAEFERLFDFVTANSFLLISIFNQEINKIRYEKAVNV